MPDSTSLPNSQAEAAIMALRAGAIDAACNYEKAGEEKAASFHRGSAFAYESAIRALRSAEQPKDTSSDLRERILDEIEDPDDCEHGHPSCAKCLYERRERLLREAADSLNRAEQANGRIELDDDAVRRGVQAGCEVGAFLLCGRPEEDAVRAIVKAALNGV